MKQRLVLCRNHLLVGVAVTNSMYSAGSESSDAFDEAWRSISNNSIADAVSGSLDPGTRLRS